jgi:phosphoadenosine phosphosulfate reductase
MSAIELYAHPSPTFAAKLKQTAELLEKAAHDYAPSDATGAARIALACSLGAEDMVLVQLIQELQLDIGIFVLETGQLHAQTLALLARLQARSRTPIEVITPAAETVLQFVQRNGTDAMYQSIDLRKACCEMRKMEPLGRALAGKAAWITGLRREQSGARAEVPVHRQQRPPACQVQPLEPLDQRRRVAFHRHEKSRLQPLARPVLPQHRLRALHTGGVSLGEDFRAGRWWWEDESAKECGLHVARRPHANATPSPTPQQEVST